MNPDKSGVVFSVMSSLVQVDAVATDGEGPKPRRPRADDFQVLIDGKPQQLTHFSYVDLSSPAPAASLARAAKNGPFCHPHLRPRCARKMCGRTIVLMVDDLGLSFESMAFVRSSLRKFIETGCNPATWWP